MGINSTESFYGCSEFDWNELLSNLTESIRIPSVREKAIEGMPFGTSVDRALRHVLECAEKLGFKTYYGDGYYGYVEIGEGKDLIGILCHVDVVPAGNEIDWQYPPFGGDQSEGYLYGRGTLDDKGALFAALYAMKRLTEKYRHLGKRIRLIVGADEETGWEGISKYKELEETPTCGFSPDADFPVVHGEKGLVKIMLRSPQACRSYNVSGGTVANVVPERCSYAGSAKNRILEHFIKQDIPFQHEGSEITAIGKAAHASINWQGINAISQMCSALTIVEEDQLARFVVDKIGKDPYGKKIFGTFEDVESGSVTINPGVIELDESGGKLLIDIRCPVTRNNEDLVQLLTTAIEPYGLEMEVMNIQQSLYVSKEDMIVQKLNEAYVEVIGKPAGPISIGGGTYAKAFERFVAFGPLFPGEEDLAHCIDERISLDSLYRCLEIYYRALEKLVLNN